ncbi:hypothetical protein SP15_275 [Bacillus phage SP-15]|uniref:Uncharacterized protein n=1 Tax=Bacillus phage SP-15 TaxID=1792032 RepID=A0A127AX01_9CAUD|nr:hypothetical protein SP15_275 [Bacillus phage SP-15]AMM45083.1 hypothetical protein SP15_275 [Bacillus phage SP-15]
MNPRRVIINKAGLEESMSFTNLLDAPNLNESRNFLKDIFDQLWNESIEEAEARNSLDEATYTGNLSRGMLFFFVDKKTANKFVTRFKELAKDAGQDENKFKFSFEEDDADEEGIMLMIRATRSFSSQRDLESKARDTYLGLMRESKELGKIDEGFNTDRNDMPVSENSCKSEVCIRLETRESQDDIFTKVSELLIQSSVGDQVSLEKELKFHNGRYEAKLEFEQHGAHRKDEVEIFFNDENASTSFFNQLVGILSAHENEVAAQIRVGREVRWIADQTSYFVVISQFQIKEFENEETEELSSPFTSDNE